MPYKSKNCEYCESSLVIKNNRDVHRKKFCSRKCRALGRVAGGEMASNLLKMRKVRKLKDRELPALRSLLATYKRHAKDRNLAWQLSEWEFRLITKSSCWYTGREPSNIQKSSAGSVYVYNGIDRVDNSVGYVLWNCVPCCAEVNYAKRDLGLNDFLDVVNDINVSLSQQTAGKVFQR